MKASELRIGNYYRQVALGGIAHVSLFTFSEWQNHIDCDDDSFGDWMSPISLTEEWLLRFGFEKRNDSNFWLNGFCLKTYDNEFYVLTEQKRVFIKFVHTLQNLYFALIGEELELPQKPKE